MQNAHYTALEAKHASLESRIVEEQARPAPDLAMLADLKRRKLRLKEELTSLQ
jgi:hypothetical protein